MVNPFRCKILHKKASLAVLSDERNAGLFDAADQAAIAAHVPWTRVVEERSTVHNGAKVDLLPFIEANQARLVLKPNDDYGGAGIVLGWTVNAEEWRQGIARAVNEPYIVQQRVPIPSEPYPSLVDGSVQILRPDARHGAVRRARRIHGRLADPSLDRRLAQCDGGRRVDGADVHGGKTVRRESMVDGR